MKSDHENWPTSMVQLHSPWWKPALSDDMKIFDGPADHNLHIVIAIVTEDGLIPIISI